jgi:hypothetical protein
VIEQLADDLAGLGIVRRPERVRRVAPVRRRVDGDHRSEPTPGIKRLDRHRDPQVLLPLVLDVLGHERGVAVVVADVLDIGETLAVGEAGVGKE